MTQAQIKPPQKRGQPWVVITDDGVFAGAHRCDAMAAAGVPLDDDAAKEFATLYPRDGL